MKNGQIVEIRNGWRFLYIDFFLIGYCGRMPVDIYDRKWNHKCFREYDIMRIYDFSGYSVDQLFDADYLTLEWERGAKSNE